jgi:hypothetical protein
MPAAGAKHAKLALANRPGAFHSLPLLALTANGRRCTAHVGPRAGFARSHNAASMSQIKQSMLRPCHHAHNRAPQHGAVCGQLTPTVTSTPLHGHLQPVSHSSRLADDGRTAACALRVAADAGAARLAHVGRSDHSTGGQAVARAAVGGAAAAADRAVDRLALVGDSRALQLRGREGRRAR